MYVYIIYIIYIYVYSVIYNNNNNNDNANLNIDTSNNLLGQKLSPFLPQATNRYYCRYRQGRAKEKKSSGGFTHYSGGFSDYSGGSF